MNTNYYAVTTKCGHVGKNNYILITFPIRAESKKEASAIARKLPRVKHHMKNAIVDAIKISKQEYIELHHKNFNDNYLLVHNIQDQKYYCPDIKGRINMMVDEVDKYEFWKERELRVQYKLKKNKLLEDLYVYAKSKQKSVIHIRSVI